MPLVTDDFTSLIFWTTQDVLNLARMIANDAQGSIAGQDLADDRPYTWWLLNLCYAKLQNALEDTNVESTTYEEWRVGPLPATSDVSDPTISSRLGYDGFADGAGNFYEYPKLPPNLLEPLEVWERPGGSVQQFTPMSQRQGGLRNIMGSGPYRYWEFRQLGLYFPASAMGNEILIRGIHAMPLFDQPLITDPPQPPQSIPLARAGLALAYMIAAEYQEIRGAANAPVTRAKADKEIAIISNQAAKRSNQSQIRRRGYGFGRRRRSVLGI